MKKLLLLLALAFVMYGCSETTFSNHKETKVDYTQDGFPKGNCKYCAERRKKEQAELINKIKEQ